MDLKIQKMAGGAAGSLAVSDAVFSSEFNEPLVHQVVTAYMAAGRAGTHAQKTRAQVRGGGIKPWKQKGSGQARAGTIRSPLWRKGGKTFAAVTADYSQKVNKKMYHGAMRSILSELLRQDRLIVVDELAIDQAKTREAVAKLDGLGLKNVLIVADRTDDKFKLAVRNLPHVALCDPAHVNPVNLLQHEKVLMTSGAVKQLEGSLS